MGLRSVLVGFLFIVMAALALGACTSILGDFTLGNEPGDGAVPVDGGHQDGPAARDTGPSMQDAPKDTKETSESSLPDTGIGAGDSAGDTQTVMGDSGTTTGGGDASGSYTIGGKVSGLAPGDSITLQDNGGDNVTVSVNGPFVFATSVSGGSMYAVTVLTQPGSPSQTCTVANGTGSVSGNVNGVVVTCVTDAFSVSGTVTGLSAGDIVTLQDNGTSNLAVDSSGGGAFTFTDTVPSGMSYSVTVLTQPAGLTCTVMNGMGPVTNANITGVQVTCVANGYTIGGTLSGLPAGNMVILQDNMANSLTLNANGAFMFTMPLMTGQMYAVSVSNQPAAAMCLVSSGMGTVSGANVTSVVVNCSAGTYTIGGTVMGIAGGESVALQNNMMVSSQIFVAGNSPFSFATPVATGTMYNVTVAASPQSPVAQTCMVTGGMGTVASANVTDIVIKCTTLDYTIGGTLVGLSGGSVVLQLNGGSNLSLSANGPFMFPQQPSGVTYNVSVLSQPPSTGCTVTNGNGTLGNANVTNVSVRCPSFLGSYLVNSGPAWGTDPMSVSCDQACAALFPGSASYGCSTTSTVLNHLAFGSQWGLSTDCTSGVPDNYSLEGPAPGYYNCGSAGCSFSAYVNDHCTAGNVTNYCWGL